MKDDLCRAFCDGITVKNVPVGLAIGTKFSRGNGDALGFYVVYDKNNINSARIEDDGTTIPLLEVSGVDFTDGPRHDSFIQLMDEYGVHYDWSESLLHTDYMPVNEISNCALSFVAFLLRVQDFLLVTRKKVEDTFKADVIKALEERFSSRGHLDFDEPVNENFRDFPADVVFRPKDGEPISFFIGTSENKALESLLFWMRSVYEFADQYKCMLIIEKAKPPQIKERTMARLMNSFPVAVFRGEEVAAIDAAERHIYGRVVKPLQ